MANEKIKGLTVKIGGDTTELNKALESVNKKSRSLSSELGQINRQLKFDPTNTELLAQKQKVLAEAIENTQNRLDTLREAEKQVQEQFKKGEIAEEQYRAFRREVMDAEKKLKSYKEAAEQTAQAVDQLGDKADKSAKEIQEQEEKAEAAEQAIDEMGDTAANVAKTGLGVLAASGAALVGTLVAVTEESREYRREMGKLDTAFEDNNHSASAAYETYSELQSILGETDQAVEASNHLSALCDTEKELNEWTDILTGVYAKFGASLPVEGLAEASNETAKTGKITGSLADALNWAGESEEDFQAALDECSTEQKRQQLIIKTLTKLYKSAATQYKKTNKEVIESNKATEKWNKSLSKIGKTVDPVITDFKELGAEILDSAAEPIEDVTEFISKKFIPALKSAGNWIRENKAPITGTLTAVTVGLVAYKAAVLASELQSKGLTVATLAQTVAQKAMNLAMAATPTGLVLAGITALAAGIIAYAKSSQEAASGVDVLTEAEKELMEAAGEAAEAFRDQQEATKEQMDGVTSQMDYVSDLVDELYNLADASGEVKDTDQARAEFILGELNEALGTEYTMVDGIIQQYGDLKDNIEDVIRAKTANSLVEAYNADYITAIQNEGKAFESLTLAQKDYDAQLEHTKKKEQEYADLREQVARELEAAETEAEQRALSSLAQTAEAKRIEFEAEEKILADKEKNLTEATTNYENYHNAILNFEAAQTAALEGNTQKAIDLLSDKSESYSAYADQVDVETAKVLDILHQEAVDAGIEAKWTKEQFEKGVDGFTEEMVKEAEDGYQEALDKFSTAYDDAYAVGQDLGRGIPAGLNSMAPSIVEAAGQSVAAALSAMREVAESKSPAKKTIDFGEDLGEGTEIGIKNSTEDVVKAAEHQTSELLKAYQIKSPNGQQIIRSIDEQQKARQAQIYQAGSTEYAGVLGEILDAVKEGKVIALDKKELVGRTADAYDKELGYRRALVARGAL